MFDMSTEDLTALKMFAQHQPETFLEPQTLSLADADLTSTRDTSESQTPEPSQRSSSPSPTVDGGDDEKKPAKKRKSWGQELPVPKTCLPPRKRAKTEDEKEQRRIERVLRNRAAAQSSRERKRQEVEKLEGEKKLVEEENHALRQQVVNAHDENYKLQQTVNKLLAQLGRNVEGMAPGPVSPEQDLFHIKIEPVDSNNGLPSPSPSRHGSATRSRSDSLQSQAVTAPLRIQTAAQPRRVPAPLDLSHRPAEMVLSHDLQCQSPMGLGMMHATLPSPITWG